MARYRYQVRSLAHNRCELHIASGRTRTYWAPFDGGYVCDVSEQPGQLGRQVCRGLSGTGSTLDWDARRPLAELIRHEARRTHVDSYTGVHWDAVDWMIDCDTADAIR